MQRITVTPADDDEVIVAGIAQPESAPQERAAEEAAPRALPETAVQAEGEPKSVPPAASGGKAPRPQKGTPADGYRETTLDDLESAPMPFAQKIIIIAAVVCIIGALVYYFALMG